MEKAVLIYVVFRNFYWNDFVSDVYVPHLRACIHIRMCAPVYVTVCFFGSSAVAVCEYLDVTATVVEDGFGHAAAWLELDYHCNHSWTSLTHGDSCILIRTLSGGAICTCGCACALFSPHHCFSVAWR